jgi:hypothetical protein
MNLTFHGRVAIRVDVRRNSVAMRSAGVGDQQARQREQGIFF